MSHIDLRDENSIRIAKFGKMAGMKVIDGIKGNWTTVGVLHQTPAFIVKEDMKLTFGAGDSIMEVFIYENSVFVLED